MKRTILATALAVATLNAMAASQGDYFEQQREITDGAPPVTVVHPRADNPRIKPESARTAAEDEWLIQERISDSHGYRPVQFVAPRPGETPAQAIAAQDAAAPFTPSH